MKLKEISKNIGNMLPDVITSKAGRSVLVTKKHSPVILFGAGVIGFGVTVILACRATLKVDEVLQEAHQKLELSKDLKHEDYSEVARKKDIAVIRVTTAVDITKLYGPAVMVGLASVCALTGSHIVLTNRVAGLTAAYAALDRGFKEYRGRVIGELGVEKDQKFRYGTVMKEVIDEDENGHVVSAIEVADPKDDDVYGRLWDSITSKSWSDRSDYNEMRLRALQRYANDKLNHQGHLFLNEVYDMLGLSRSRAGAVVGWVRNNKRGGDNYVDFNIFKDDAFVGERFVNGVQVGVWLDFNVDGIVYDLLEE